jgi:hypothetical protein
MNKTKQAPRSSTRRNSPPALRNARPDQRSTSEPDARNADDKDGNESHARARGVSNKATKRPRATHSRA